MQIISYPYSHSGGQISGYNQHSHNGLPSQAAMPSTLMQRSHKQPGRALNLGDYLSSYMNSYISHSTEQAAKQIRDHHFSN